MQMTEEEICERFKRNGCYKGNIPILAQLNAVDVVVYRALYGDGGTWVRPADMWNETIERDGKTYNRFEKIQDSRRL